MKIVAKISVSELKEMANKMFGSLVKADVDIVKNIMIIDMPMHYEGEQELLEKGSNQQDLWGINLHPEFFGTDEFIEFDSMINIRPSSGNPSKDVLDPEVKKKIIAMVGEVVCE
jgi:hypothetical protein